MLEAIAHELNPFFPQADGVRDDGDLRIESTKGEVVLSDVGMKNQQDIVVSGD